MGRRAWAINSRLSFSDLVHDEKRQDASIPVTTSIAIEKFAETVSCQAEVHDVEKKKERFGLSLFKIRIRIACT
jgi:hypothetical protein